MAKKQKAQPCFSGCIDDFCAMVNQAQTDFAWNTAEISRLDKLTQDYLHMLELGDLDYRERAKVATKLAECRRLRRESKDTVEILEPFVSFAESDRGRNMMNLMREALGKTRRAEERMKTRTYRFKVLEDGAI